MRYAFISSALIAGASAHGVVTSIEGANNVSMPGLSVTDGTPRDCSSNGCGSQADTAIMRNRDMSRGSPLGKTQGNGPVDAKMMIENFMGMNRASTSNAGNTGSGQEDDLSGLPGGQSAQQRRDERKMYVRALLGGLLGGGGGGGGDGQGGGKGGGAAGLLGGAGGLLGGGGAGGNKGKKGNLPAEKSVADTMGIGAQMGLPTADDQGMVTMVFRQINQDGAGPLQASIDGTSGGTDNSAFQDAKVMQDVPGLGVGGLSLATNTDFPVKVQVPQGMTCDANVGGASNVCIVRVRNNAAAGPFGGSAAFTQTPAARKRAVAYRLRKRAEAEGQSFDEAVKAEEAEEGDLAKRFRIEESNDAASLAAADKAEEQEDKRDLNKRFRIEESTDATSLAAADKAEEQEDN